MINEKDILCMQNRYLVKLATARDEIEAAQRLRFEVFNLELGAGLPESYQTGLDRDIYDDYCDHLLVMDAASGAVVGTYRLLPGVVAENSVGYYSETEFDLSAIRKIPGSKLELGRSCVHRDFRNAAVITLLWRGIASYVERYDIGFLFGCGSLHTSNAAEVSMVYSYLNRFHRAEERFQVRPLTKLNDVSMFPFCDKEQAYAALSPLMKGYLRLGAQICGEPAYDPLFETADFFVLLDSRKVLDRYRNRFLGRTSEQVCAA